MHDIVDIKFAATAVRILSAEAIQRANSGHPGLPLGMADIAVVLWKEFLKHNPKNPTWPDRDRFVLSNGHGSMLLYSLLHLTGYDVSIDDIKTFRQLGSITPGHPEFGKTPGVDATTGPLGQGIANAIGMAIAEKLLSERFNRPGFKIVDHYTYVFAGDGCLMEGISYEACSLAGLHKLNKLILFWDNNKISIDGNTRGWFQEDIKKRFESCGWNVIDDIDGYNAEKIKVAIEQARSNEKGPSIICCNTIIGFGSPNFAGKETCHGAPLGDAEIKKMRENLGWTFDDPFFVPDEIYKYMNKVGIGQALNEKWDATFSEYAKQYPELAKEFSRRLDQALPEGLDHALFNSVVKKLTKNKSENRDNAIATRNASHNVLNVIAPMLPELIGGCADLTTSVMTNWDGMRDVFEFRDGTGNYVRYGVREFAMIAISNGLALHGGFIPYCGTFLSFADYGRSAIRTAAISKIRSIFIFSHDSICVGEDGPTHRPVEQIACLRLIPNLILWRPCSEVETFVAWQNALSAKNNPTCLILSRQKIQLFCDEFGSSKGAVTTSSTPNLDDLLRERIGAVNKGGYVLFETDGAGGVDSHELPSCVLIATGSEVAIAIRVAMIIHKNLKKKIRVVSMPSTTIFDQQTSSYKDSVLLSNEVQLTVAIEAAHPVTWHKYVGKNGLIFGIESFGLSGKEVDVYNYFGFNAERIAKNIVGLLNERRNYTISRL